VVYQERKNSKKLTAKRTGINAENKDQNSCPRMNTNQEQKNGSGTACRARTEIICAVHSGLPKDKNASVNAKRKNPPFLQRKFLGNEKA